MADLLEMYAKLGGFRKPLLRMAPIQERFERAGRRPRQLDPMTEVRRPALRMCKGG